MRSRSGPSPKKKEQKETAAAAAAAAAAATTVQLHTLAFETCEAHTVLDCRRAKDDTKIVYYCINARGFKVYRQGLSVPRSPTSIAGRTCRLPNLPAPSRCQPLPGLAREAHRWNAPNTCRCQRRRLYGLSGQQACTRRFPRTLVQTKGLLVPTALLELGTFARWSLQGWSRRWSPTHARSC